MDGGAFMSEEKHYVGRTETCLNNLNLKMIAIALFLFEKQAKDYKGEEIHKFILSPVK